jgi:hypothetical protein
MFGDAKRTGFVTPPPIQKAKGEIRSPLSNAEISLNS